MTDDELHKMAEKTAAYGVHPSGEYIYSFYTEQLQAFTKLVAEHEREACAKIVDENIGFENYLSEIIRAKGQA
jgi:hypothetical protein